MVTNIKRTINFPPIYHSKDNIDFITKDDPTIRFHLLDTKIMYDLYNDEVVTTFYHTINNFDVHKVFTLAEMIDITPVGNKQKTTLAKEFSFPEMGYPGFIIYRDGKEIEINPAPFITFQFSKNPPLQIIIHDDLLAIPIELNTNGEIINKPGQFFVKWLD